MRKTIGRKDLVYPELSYQIVGILFEVYNQLGAGYHEKYYQRAIATELKRCNLSFKEQVFIPLHFKNEIIGRQYLDFLIEGKIVLEIKKGDRFSKRNIDQILEYLKVTGLKLGILANFGSKDLKFKRIVNLNS
jgi:GxxExxY protein